MTVEGNGALPRHLPSLFDDQQRLELDTGNTAFGGAISRCSCLSTEGSTLESIVVPREPESESSVDLFSGLRLPDFSDKVVLDEPPEALDLPLGLGSPRPEQVNPETLGIPLIVGLTKSRSGLVLTPFVLEHLVGKTPPCECFVPDLEDIHLPLSSEPSSGKTKPAVIIDDRDKVQDPDPWELDLPHDVGLPQLIRGTSFKADDRFYPNEILSIESSTNDYSPYRGLMDGKTELITDVSRRPPPISRFELDDLCSSLLIEFPVIAVSTINESVGSSQKKCLSVSLDAPPTTPENVGCLLNADRSREESLDHVVSLSTVTRHVFTSFLGGDHTRFRRRLLRQLRC